MNRLKRWVNYRLFLFGFGPWFVACAAVQPVGEAATCSPNADAWHAVQLETVCAGKLIPEECPEAQAVGDEYRRREALECSSKP